MAFIKIAPYELLAFSVNRPLAQPPFQPLARFATIRDCRLHNGPERVADSCQQSCYPAAPGVYYIFRDDELKWAYLTSKYRRRIAAPRKRIAEIRYEENRDTLDALIETITELGRLPEPEEFSLSEPAIEAFRSLKRAFALIRRVTSEDDWEAVRKQRSEDLLVYLALANFGKRPKLSDLSQKSTITFGASWQTTTRDSASREAETVQSLGWGWSRLTRRGPVAGDKGSNTLHHPA